MNSSDHSDPLRGEETASVPAVASCSADQDEMKRAAARQLIENYYYQLTSGCGDSSCDNQCCASCPDFSYKSVDRNQLALQAVTLSRSRARLCEGIPQKYAKFPVQESGGTQAAASGSSKGNSRDDGTSVDLQGGAKSKITQSPSGASIDTLSASSSRADQSKETKISHEVQFLDEERVASLVKQGHATGNWNHLIRTIGFVFSNPDSLMLSFQRQDSVSRQQHQDPDKDIDDTEADAMHVDKIPVQEQGDRARDSPSPTKGKSNRETEISDADCRLTVDLDSLHRSFEQLTSIPGQPFEGALINALLTLARTVEMDFKYHHTLETNPRFLNIFLIIMEFPELHSPEYLDTAFPAVCKALGKMPVSGQARLAKLWALYGKERLMDMVHMLQQLMTVRIINNEGRWGRSFHLNDDDAIVGACSVLKVVYYASLYGGAHDSHELVEEEKIAHEADLIHEAMGIEPKEQSQPKEDPLEKELGVSAINVRQPLIPYEEFVNEPLNEHIDISTDYACYRAEPDSKFSFMTHNFVLTTASKHMSMYFDNRIRMLHERRTSLLQTIMHGSPPMPYLRIRVRRDHVVDDALVNLEMVAMENPADLKKQLFVEFDGEQGLDEGGVSKEFFQLIVEELFNPDIGMFTFNEKTHHFWFNPMSFENDGQFTLIGIVLGLAIYNSCILDIHLPMVVYRKLLGKKGVFQDLFDVDPTLASSLNHMLEYDGDDFEDVFMQTFKIGFHDIFGTSVSHELKEGGADITVTQDNKQEFVDLYADFILNKSIERQFRAFKRGFTMVTSESPLKTLFRPDEVEMLVCGSKEFDFHALEEATEYDGGFTSDSATVQNFWQVVHEFSEEDKKKLLQFSTGSDRVPVGGLSKLKFIVARNGPDSDKLPTSHTCFNVLLLPDYSTKEKLRERLVKAINYAKGFGML